MIANDPDGDEPKDQIAKTYFNARKRVDGTVELKGHLDKVTGQAFLTAWQHEVQKLFRASQDSDEPQPRPNSAQSAI